MLVALDSASAFHSIDRGRTALPASCLGGPNLAPEGSQLSVNVNGALPPEQLTLARVHQALLQSVRELKRLKAAVVLTSNAALQPRSQTAMPREVLPQQWKVGEMGVGGVRVYSCWRRTA